MTRSGRFPTALIFAPFFLTNTQMKPRRIFSALLLSLGLILLTFAATCRLVMTNIQIDYDPSSPATVTLTVFGQSDEYALAIDAD